MHWRVSLHPEVQQWVSRLSAANQASVVSAIDLLAAEGPLLRRPLVGLVSTSRHANMKELRPAATSLRLLFAFDPERAAIVLVAGDKRGAWTQWYREHVPIADARFEEHLKNLGR